MLYDNFLTTGAEELRNLERLVEHEQAATCDVVEALGRIEREEFHITAGYSSLFSYCTVALQYSEPAALRRIKAARCARRFGRARELLRQRKLNLTTICLLAEVLNHENADRLLEQAAGKTKAEVAELVATLRPMAPMHLLHDEVQPIVVASPCKKQQRLPLADGRPSPNGEAAPDALLAGQPKSLIEQQLEEKFGPLIRPENYETVPEQRLRVKFCAAPSFSEKLERMRRLLSGKYLRGASLEDIFTEAIDCYIRHNCPVEKARRALVRRQAAEEPKTKREARQGRAKTSRHVPAGIRLQVYLRDGCQCTYVAPDGTRCESREQIQIDHILPFAQGGSHDPENLRCLCRAHNGMEASRAFGEEHMRQFRRRAV